MEPTQWAIKEQERKLQENKGEMQGLKKAN